jgi:hypothetical protein
VLPSNSAARDRVGRRVAEQLRELRGQPGERHARGEELLVAHPLLRTEHAHRAVDPAGVGEHRHRDAAQALVLLLVVDRVPGGPDAAQLGVERRARGDGLRREAGHAGAREIGLHLRARQPRGDRLSDRGAVDRALRANVLHDAHRPVGLALGDDPYRAAEPGGDARALAGGAGELLEERLRELRELAGRPGAAGELVEPVRELVAAGLRLLAEIARADERLQQVMHGAAMQAHPARRLRERGRAARRRHRLEHGEAALERAVGDPGARRRARRRP